MVSRCCQVSTSIPAEFGFGIDYSKCLDWTPWGNALGANSSGGTYTIGYIFYVVFSVSISLSLTIKALLTISRFSLLHVLASWCEIMPFMLDTVESPRSKRSSVVLLSDISWGHGRLPLNHWA